MAVPCTADLQAADLKACPTVDVTACRNLFLGLWSSGRRGAGRRGVLLNPRPFKYGHTEFVGSDRPDVETVESRGSRGTAGHMAR